MYHLKTHSGFCSSNRCSLRTHSAVRSSVQPTRSRSSVHRQDSYADSGSPGPQATVHLDECADYRLSSVFKPPDLPMSLFHIHPSAPAP